MGPRWARRPEEGSPQESAGVPANTRECARKKANSELLTFVYWWWKANEKEAVHVQVLRGPQGCAAVMQSIRGE